jgi:hypothetical protein
MLLSETLKLPPELLQRPSKRSGVVMDIPYCDRGGQEYLSVGEAQ